MDASTAQAALDLVTEAVVVLAPDFALVHANRAAQDLLTAVGVEHRAGTRCDGLRAWTDPTSASTFSEIVARGRAWRGSLSVGAADASDVLFDVTFAPVNTASRDAARFVVVLRDSTGAGRESELAQRAADRSVVLSVMHDVRPEATIEATSMSLCRAVARIEGMDGAMVLLLPTVGDLVYVSSVGVEVPGFSYASTIPLENLELLISMTEAGPWWLDLEDPATRDLVGSDLVDTLVARGITATGYAAITQEGATSGVLSVASTSPDGRVLIPRQLETLEQIGAFAGVVLANQAVVFGRDEAVRRGVRDIIDNRRFRTYVQPIVRLATGAQVGYEALTRFDDGRLPDAWLYDAHAVGLGLELEEACATSALATMHDIDTGLWLAVNFSPSAVVGGVVERTLGSPGRHIVVEITEHSAIDNYDELRLAMAKWVDFDVSIDDAGAGFASLRHILELAPTFVKLDIGIVRDVDTDPAKAAMVAGMCHFAAATGTTLIAEGIETAEEAATMRDLGVDLGQGYFFERPTPPRR